MGKWRQDIMRHALAIITYAAALGAAPLSAETVLLMAEEPGCSWCEAWNKDIGHIYPKSAEGKIAPLKRFDLHDGMPEGIKTNSRVHYTPTFLLVEDNVEIGRIEGYPGEDFFWGLLAMLLDDAGISLADQEN